MYQQIMSYSRELLIVSALVVSINGCVKSWANVVIRDSYPFSVYNFGFSWAQNLFTDDKGVATFKGIPFMTSAGPCTSSIPKASIKWWNPLLGPKTKKTESSGPFDGILFWIWTLPVNVTIYKQGVVFCFVFVLFL